MPLTEEEKQALKEKYKQQRRAMWAGKRTSDASNELASQEVTHPNAETEIPAHHVTHDRDQRPHSVNSPLPSDSDDTDNAESQKGTIAKIANEKFCPTDSTGSQSSQQLATGDAESRKLNSAEHKPTVHNSQTSYTTPLVDKIKAEWEGRSSIRPNRQKRRRKDQKAEVKSASQIKKKGEPAMLTWKLVLGVIGTIIVLIAIGIMLGMWFANQ